LNRDTKVTVLCGGFGAARFLSGLGRLQVELTCVVNTADDLVYAGLHVSPDVDTVCYALAGRFDEGRGWGLVGDSFRNAQALGRFGGGWFAVGDEDLATHLRRTALLEAGATLTEATADLARSLGVAATILPMSDDPVRTIIVTDEGRLSFQDWLVRRRGEPAVRAVEHQGLEAARPSASVLEAIEGADLVVLAPSNPVQSLGPILGLSGVQEAVAGGTAVAITPVVSGAAPATAPERARAHVREVFMAARGLAHRATDVARLYVGLVGTFVLDERDAEERRSVEDLGVAVLLADTLNPSILWTELHGMSG
jgi:LPPG:FO 2-phospho-L-lactate transferase